VSINTRSIAQPVLPSSTSTRRNISRTRENESNNGFEENLQEQLGSIYSLFRVVKIVSLYTRDEYELLVVLVVLVVNDRKNK
jgi:hypothetical protein